MNMGPRHLALTFLFAAVSCFTPAHASKVETWKQDTGTAFSKGKRQGVVVSDTGRVRLAREVFGAGKLEAVRVWDLARTSRGALFAATGDAGKVYMREGEGDWSVVFSGEDSQVFCLVALPDGRVLGGTGPNGTVVDLTDPRHPATRLDSAVQYVWDLAADARGNVYAATGPTGQVWKRGTDGKWSLHFDSKQTHVLCLAIVPDGSVYAGSDGEGIVYKITPEGSATVVFDAPQSEVRALLVAPDGSVYAGTAAEAPSPAAATGRPSPGDNAVYRIDPRGAAREVFKAAKTLIFSLAWQDDRLLVGTGPDGLLFEVNPDDRETTQLARVDHGQVLSLLLDPKGGVLMGAGDPGAVLRLAPGLGTSGTLTSDVFDTKLASRFGAVAWRGNVPSGTKLSVQVRTGNSGEPDATWSEWSPAITDTGAGSPKLRSGRFVQYRANLATFDTSATPELRAVTVRYQSINVAPEITKLDVPDLSEGDGTAAKPKLTIKWDASDANGDALVYTVQLRKEGWPDWVTLEDRPRTEKSYDLDLATLPDGLYRIRISASDRNSNDPAEALVKDRVSEPFLVDHRPPTVSVLVKPGIATALLKDDLTRIAKAEYALDGGEWVPVFPIDGLFDTGNETVAITLKDLKPGTHVLVVRSADAAGNVGSADAVFTVK
jgi:hypothetical protein